MDNDPKIKTVDALPQERQRIAHQIAGVLQDKCSLAVLFGSFLEDMPFRDIDIMIALKEGMPPLDADRVYLAQILEAKTGFPVDVVGIDVPNILLRGEIGRKGLPIIMADDSLWEDFRFRAWIDEIDYRPLIERFYEERFETE